MSISQVIRCKRNNLALKFLSLSTTLIVLFLSSCRNHQIAKFEVSNDSENTIDSLYIKVNDTIQPLMFIKLEEGDKRHIDLDMTNIGLGDGDYLIGYKFIEKDTIFSMRFGYYTNGSPSEKETIISIKKDTILFDYIY